MGEFIPLSVPNFEGNEEKYVMDAVKQGWVSTGGAYITELEDKLAEYLNVEQAVACQSGTSALHLALVESGVCPGDMVIVPTLTFIAAVNPVKYQFAEPVFMDCDDSLCMDTDKLREFCENECEFDGQVLLYKATKQRVRAIIVVHVFGNLADMEKIMSIANTYKLKVIEDATEALGSRFIGGCFEGKMAGTIGDFGAFSFNGNKIITTGGGGAVVAKDKKMLNHIKYLSTQAKDDVLYYTHNEVGYNYRMTNLQAALGVAQIEMLPEFIRRKQQNYQLYKEKIDKLSNVRLLPFKKEIYSNMWFYSLELNTRISVHDMIEALQKQGVQSRPIWGLIHKQKPYVNNIAYRIEKAQQYSERIINIPCSTNLSEEQINRVVEEIKKLI